MKIAHQNAAVYLAMLLLVSCAGEAATAAAATDALPKNAATNNALSEAADHSAPVAGTHSPHALPNILVIIADDMAWDDCGAYGNTRIRTPNLDRMAREGLRFDNAYLTCSSCSPSRASILTGRYPHSTGAPELHQPLPASQTMMTEPLRAAGYYTAAAGKWHLGPKVFDKFDYVQFKNHFPDGVEAYTDWLRLLRERPKDRPFFFWYASSDPHRPYYPGAVNPPHRPEDVTVPPYLPDCPATRGDLALYYDEVSRLDENVGQVLAELQRQNLAESTIVVFLSDNGRPFPRCKTTVYDSGVKTPFIVWAPGRVAAGGVAKGLVSTVDLAPTILELAGVAAPKTFQGRSFAELLTDPAKPFREYVFSEHNWHDYEAFARGVRSDRYGYTYCGAPELPMTPPADAVAAPTFQAMRRLRDEGKLPPEQRQCFVTPRPVEELYDLNADPESFHNLADDPQHAAALEKMRAVFAAWQRETGDEKPAHLTPDRFDRETGAPLGSKKE